MSEDRITTKMFFDNLEEIWIVCPNCKRETLHKILSSAEVSGSYDGWVDFCDILQIIQCNGCKYSSFRKIHSGSDLVGQDPETGEKFPYNEEDVYPARIEGRSPIKYMGLLPSIIQKIYTETNSAIINKMQVLAGVGIRSLIEAVCIEKEIKGNNLEKKIDNLKNLGLLTTDGATILHNLRIMGNKATHEIKPHTERQLLLAMDVIEHLLEGGSLYFTYTFKEIISR